MGRHTVAAVWVALLLAVACGGESEATVNGTWAEEAEATVALLADAYDLADPYQTARFFTAGGTLDMTVWGLGVAKTPDEVVKAVRRLWFLGQDVRADHLFVSPDSALVWWSAYDEEGAGGSTWVQTYFFGKGGQTAAMTFRNVEGTEERDTPEELAAEALAERYFEAWENRDRVALSGLYSPAVVVRDELNGAEWRSAAELLADLDDASPLQAGPAPTIFTHQDGKAVQLILLAQLGGECPRLEARRLVLSGETIDRETRYTHVPSAQRCLTDLADGWWTSFELPPDLQNNVTEVLDVGGSLVELVNAEPIHEEFTSWLFDRFLESGIGVPEVAAVWYPPAPECDELGGLAIESDERYAGRHTVVICWSADRLEYEDSASGWNQGAAALGLHEIAHIWMVDHLTDDVRDAFNELVGLSTWRAADTKWAERGVEQAAFTIPWAITGAEDAVWPVYFGREKPTCEELTERYRLLTNRDPVTQCGEDGWS
jgi:hypothetical protein